MRTTAKSLVAVIFAAVTMLALLFLLAPGPAPERAPAGPATAPSVAPAAAPAASTGNSAPLPAAVASAPDNLPTITEDGKYYFDVVNHSPEEFRALLKRASMIYEMTAPEARSELEVVLVLHGPDIGFFADGNRDEYGDIVDLAAQLDAFGVFDFKVCTVSANRLGLDIDDVPPFIEFVPYGPSEISELENAGFVRF